VDGRERNEERERGGVVFLSSPLRERAAPSTLISPHPSLSSSLSLSSLLPFLLLI